MSVDVVCSALVINNTKRAGKATLNFPGDPVAKQATLWAGNEELYHLGIFITTFATTNFARDPCK